VRILRAIDLKVLRDVGRMRGQLAAIALVIGCGVGVFLGMRATMRSLETARSTYYAHERFGDVFVGLSRAPETVARKLRAIPDVQRVETRVVANVTLDVPGMTETAIGRLVSIPDRGRPAINDVRLMGGRMPRAGHWEEVLVSEGFAVAHGMVPGDEVAAVINGNEQRLRLVGTVLSPEYTYAVGPGSPFPDDRRFGVFWMRRRALAASFDMESAFNDVSLRVARDANVEAVLQRVDEVLRRYGGLGAVARKDQTSAFFLENELTQLRTFALMVPVLFLLVAAFLLNVVVGRIVASQREQIAALKAFGYRDREVGRHYALLVAIVLAGGWVLGFALAAWMGTAMTRMYADYYRLPELAFRIGGREAFEALGLSAAAAALGAWAAVHRTVTLPPAEGMRPAAPGAYRATLLERLGLARHMPTPARMVLREVERRPLRAALSIAGIAAATGLTVLNAFTLDSVIHMLNVQFGLQQREDMDLTLLEPRAAGALSTLEALPGVIHAEPYRTVPVKLRSGPRSKSTAIVGVRREDQLSNLLDVELRTIELPVDGLVLSRKLAEVLEVTAGDTLRVEVLEGARPEREVRVARLAETFIGTTAHMELEALSRLLGEPVSLNGARLLVDDARLDELHSAVRRRPAVAGVISRDAVLRTVRKMLDENLGTFVIISLSFSLALAFGVLYNAARITLAERARELASLRVLGFRRREVAAILLGEIGLLVMIALPLGLAAGRVLAGFLARSPGYNNEQFRLPLVIAPSTYATAALTVVAAAVVSGWSAWRKLDRIEIVEVLKARD
jgi:putative ABC transport system permease protein